MNYTHGTDASELINSAWRREQSRRVRAVASVRHADAVLTIGLGVTHLP